MTEAIASAMGLNRTGEEDQEMGKVREIFDRALNALVDATSLAKTVEQLKVDLESLKVQVTHYRNTIANQDDQITRLRQDRDAARTAQYQAEDTARHMVTNLEDHKREVDSLSSANVRLNDRVSELTKERDEAQFKLLEIQESHSVLSQKLDNIKAQFATLFPPEPPLLYYGAPTPLAADQKHTSQTSGEVIYATEEPRTVPDPETWPQDIR
jgi:chromosome segregation ATPase